MKPKIAASISLTVLGLALSGTTLAGTALAAPAKSGCVFFCDDAAKAATAKKAEPATEALGGGNDLDTAIGQAQAARKAGDFAGASRILSQLVLFAPDDPRVLGEYGKTLAAQGRSDDALAFLDRAIQLQPGDSSLYSAQGVAYDQKGAYQAAQTSYSRALALKPGDPAVLNNAALSHMQSGDLDGAKTLLEQASPGTKDFPRIADNLALVQRLIAARPVTPPPAILTPVVPPPVPVTPPPPAPLAAAPAPEPAPVQVAVAPAQPEPMPAIVMPKVETAALAEPKTEPKPVEASAPPSAGYAALAADPTVRMAPVPKDEPTTGAPRQLTKPVPAPEKRVVIARADIAPAAKPNQLHSLSAYYVQAGAYASEDRAGKLAHDLDSLGARVSSATVDGRPVYRVRIGPFLDKDQANAAVNQAQSMGHADLRIVSDQ